MVRWMLLLLVASVAAERLMEQGRAQRVKDHRHEDFEEFEDDFVEEDDHRGIPVVEDDVPEWVKLTFADKFIALGESEFLSLGEDIDPAEFDKDEENEDQDGEALNPHNEDEYEYVYSDDEGFEFDPDRDILVFDPKKVKQEKAAAAAAAAAQGDAAVYEEDSEGEEQLVGDSEEELGKRVRAHRSRITAPPISIPINSPASSWTGQVDREVGDALSLLELEQKAVPKGPPSHTPGSRRAARGHSTQAPPQFATERLSPLAAAESQSYAPVTMALKDVPARYRTRGVGLNPKDPRFKAPPADFPISAATAFVEEEAWLEDGGDLPLMKDTQHVARNHKEWLDKNSEKEVQLPSVKEHMYANGLPVAQWEVGYVDNVLKQFGY